MKQDFHVLEHTGETDAAVGSVGPQKERADLADEKPATYGLPGGILAAAFACAAVAGEDTGPDNTVAPVEGALVHGTSADLVACVARHCTRPELVRSPWG